MEIKQGRSTLTITVTTDDETPVETRKVVVRRGRKSNTFVVERNTETDTILSVDGMPVPEPSEDESLHTKMIREAAAALARMDDKAPETA